MASAIHNFFIEQGSNFDITFEYLDENGNPIAIEPSDCVRLRIKTDKNTYSSLRNESSTDISKERLLTKTVDPDPQSTLQNNQIKWIIPSTVTKTYDFATAYYALDLVKGGSESNTTKLATGQIGLIRDLFITECLNNSLLSTCKDCIDISNSIDGIYQSDPAIIPTTTPQGSSVPVDPTITPTPTPTNNAGPAPFSQDLCDYICKGLDLFAEMYTGSGILLQDAANNSGVSSASLSNSTISIANTGISANIEVYIDTLRHENPEDLTLFLQPPTGLPILLSHRNKINNYNKNSGLSFAFSNKAMPNNYLYNKSSNDLYINILQNSGLSLPSPYDTTYVYNFNHMINTQVSGEWSLNFIDHDPGGTGTIKNWNLIVTYIPPNYDDVL